MRESGVETMLTQTSEEDELVTCWRFEQFLLLGFEEEAAFDLASSAADLHQARKLIGDGCPHDMALRIVF